MNNSKILHCSSCGASLDASINQAYIFCQFCGAKNVIESEVMTTNINISDTISIAAKTELESMIQSAEYAISIKQYDKANEIILAILMTTSAVDYRVHIAKVKIDLMLDDGKSLFESLQKLEELENQLGDNVTKAIEELMHYRGINGVSTLHNAAFHEKMDWVVFCTEHGSDVNLRAGMNDVTPISIIYVPISRELSNLEGRPFIRNKNKVKEIRKYLMSKGARDGFRLI